MDLSLYFGIGLLISMITISYMVKVLYSGDDSSARSMAEFYAELAVIFLFFLPAIILIWPSVIAFIIVFVSLKIFLGINI